MIPDAKVYIATLEEVNSPDGDRRWSVVVLPVEKADVAPANANDSRDVCQFVMISDILSALLLLIR